MRGHGSTYGFKQEWFSASRTDVAGLFFVVVLVILLVALLKAFRG